VKFDDLMGQRFDRLSVVGRAKKVDRRTRWLCRCDCGALPIILAQSLKSGVTRSCGCLHLDDLRERCHSLSLTGQLFGRLTVMAEDAIRPHGTNGHTSRTWRCHCACGNEIILSTASLSSGNTRSCGCLSRDVHAELFFVHGHTVGGKQSGTYKTWHDMLRRCYKPKTPGYYLYGGRGISVCGRWFVFANFLEDLGKRPSGMTLDRKDNDCGYYKQNCRWATAKEQSRNTRATKLNDVSVALIRYMRRRGTKRGPLAHAFGVSKHTITTVVGRRAWA
jgi:hypothetical protein